MFCLSFSFTPLAFLFFIAFYYTSFYSRPFKDTLSVLIELHTFAVLVFTDATVELEIVSNSDLTYDPETNKHRIQFYGRIKKSHSDFNHISKNLIKHLLSNEST